MFRHLLVPTDGSDLSAAAIRRAASFAAETGARITLLHVIESVLLSPGGSLFGDPLLADPGLPERLQRVEREHAEQLLARDRELVASAGVACAVELAEPGPIHAAIHEAAQRHGCDLIFMASHGRKGLAGWVLGSETQRVLAHAALPVLVYREPPSTEG
ncbi:MAG: universal stress protein [Synechococcaceae cyanobacterium]|jgi:nucleotide-binding universal stress UspA family protein|nr:universal stress protein [Synechococcaceae cyanobacterium]